MCYKVDHNNKLHKNIDSRLGSINNEIITGYFKKLKMGESKKDYFPTIIKFLETMIEKEIIKEQELSQITLDDLRGVRSWHATEYLDDCAKHYKDTTLVTIKKRLSSFWTYLCDEYTGFKNIFKAMQKGKFEIVIDKEGKTPSDDELDALLERLANESKGSFMKVRNVAIVRLLADSGLRISELVGMDIDDIYLDNDDPYIMVLRKGYIKEGNKKKVKLFSSTIPYLKQWIEIRPDCVALFTDKNANRVKVRNLQKMIGTYSDGSITPHMLRHYYATRLYSLGFDEVFIQDQLGHVRGSAITKDVYVSSNVNRNLEMLKAL